jgi:hypothetical protein
MLSTSLAIVTELLTWKSPKDEANEYRRVMVVNWMSE